MARLPVATGDPLLAAFAALVSDHPGAPVVVSGRRRASRIEVDQAARTVARALRRFDLAAGDVVGLLAGNGPAFLASLLALRRLGSAVLLLDADDSRAGRLRVATCLRARGVVTCRSVWEMSEEHVGWEPTGLERAEVARVDPEVAVIKLTSGSTGRPRGVVAPTRSLLADECQLASSMGLEDAERIVAALPMSFSYGFSSIVLPALTRGATLIVPEGKTPLAAMRSASSHRATFLPTVPSYISALSRLSAPPSKPDSLRLVVSAGAPLVPATATRFRERFGMPVHVFYGATECGGSCFDRTGTAAERGSVGTPVDGVRVEVDGETDAGCVVVESAAVGAGYLPGDDTRLSRGRFVTADCGSWRDGELVLEGRLDDLINIKGRMVSPHEVESVLRKIDGVDDVAVLGLPRANGEGELLGAVLAVEASAPGPDELRAWCATRLPKHKVPSSFVLVDSIPRTPRGKIDRTALRDLRSGGSAGRPGAP